VPWPASIPDIDVEWLSLRGGLEGDVERLGWRAVPEGDVERLGWRAMPDIDAECVGSCARVRPCRDEHSARTDRAACLPWGLSRR
jgi:hypothetical protein